MSRQMCPPPPFAFQNSAFGIFRIHHIAPQGWLEGMLPFARTKLALPCLHFYSSFFLHLSNFPSLPGQLFYSTQIPVCLWFLAKNKAADAKRGFRDRRKQTLFIDARKLGTVIDRVPFNFSEN